ncbi:hypothetical protein [Luteimonas sp. A501]
MHRFLVTALLLCAVGSASAQNYASGEHVLDSAQGELRINVGLVSHLNAHTFHVYTFQFRPSGETAWHQLPLVRDAADPALDFILTRTATADFTTRDARLAVDGPAPGLAIAALEYEDTPYDDDARVRVETFALKRLDEEGRWIFERQGESLAAPGTTIEEALRP